MFRKDHNNGYNDTTLKTLILFIQCNVNWFANLPPTNTQFSILYFTITWLLHVLERHHWCSLPEDGSFVASCRSKLILKYTIWNYAFLPAGFVNCWRLILLSYETMSTSKYITKFRPILLLQINPTRCTILLIIFISRLFTFRANMCPSSGKITISKRHWYLSLQPADQTAPLQSGKYQCRINTVISPDDGHMVARNM